MIHPKMSRLLVVLARLVGFAAATLTISLVVWFGSKMIPHLFFEDPRWGEVGIFPVLLPIRLIIAAWIIWSVFKQDASRLQVVLLISGTGSYLFLLGWYFMLFGRSGELVSFDNILYLLAVCDLLYLVAGLVLVVGRLAGAGQTGHEREMRSGGHV